eukprot:Rmarinus@m.19004
MVVHKSKYPMIEVHDALECIIQCAPLLEGETVRFDEALGRTLAHDIVCKEDFPPFPASIKDGYAVVAADGEGIYPIVGHVTAGTDACPTVAPGSIAYITTGSPVPPGADAVIQIENTETLEGQKDANGCQLVRIVKPASSPGQDIRKVGSDIPAGTTVLRRGDELTPADIGLLAMVNHTEVSVHRRTIVGVLSTGDELADAGTEEATNPKPGMIRDSNRPMLLAAVRQAGAAPVDLGVVSDKKATLENVLEDALRKCDVIITSGGVSMGNLDLVKPFLEERGHVRFGRLNMKPGKPTTFATVTAKDYNEVSRERLVFALPGNPVSSIVTFNLLVLPALRKMMGVPKPHHPKVKVQLRETLKLDPERPEYHRLHVWWDDAAGCLAGSSTGRQISSRLLSLRSATALGLLPKAEGVLPEGSLVEASLISQLPTLE